MTCKDCLHGELCDTMTELTPFTKTEYRDLDNVEKFCENFKNKADFVEVVRCKDCNLSSEPKSVSRYDLYCNNYDVRFCEKEQKIVRATHFCSYGKRK